MLEILGAEYARGSWFEEDDLKGFLGVPEEAKATRSGQLFLLNRRPIFSPLLSRALKDGYGTRIASNAHPAAVLLFELDPAEFDVNVHPQKREVRFRRESALFAKTVKTVQRAFLPECQPVSPFVFSERIAPAFFTSREEPLFFEPPPVEKQIDFLPQEPAGRPLAVLGPFLLFEQQGNLYVADLGAVCEERALETEEKQALLIPIECPLSLEESQMAGELMDHLEKAGLDARLLGPKRFCIDAVPEWLDPGKLEPLMRALKEDLLKGIPVEATLRRVARSGFSKNFTLEEAAALWRQGKAIRQICLEPTDLERFFIKQ